MKMRIRLFILLLLIVGTLTAQQREYYFGANGRIDDGNTKQTRISIKQKNSKRLMLTTSFYNKGEWFEMSREKWKKIDENSYQIKTQKGKKHITFVRSYHLLETGKWQFTDAIKQRIIRRGTCIQQIPLILDGLETSYYKNGSVSSEAVYRNNELISNKNWLENGVPYFDNLFDSADRYPSYSRGNEQLNEAVFQKLKDNKVDFSRIDGQMLVGFVVFPDGKIGGFRVLKGITPHLDRLVVDALRELDAPWIPAQLNGNNVRFFQKYPINFSHDEYQLEFFDLSSGLAQFERK